MLYKEYVKISNVSIHRIGSRSCQEGVDLSVQEVNFADGIAEVLKTYFLHPFKSEEVYQFVHVSDLAYNEIYNFSSNIFDDVSCFHEQSINIAKYLYEQSGHPNVKRGELYVVYFKNCILDGNTIDAIGIFKSENKDTFLRINSIDGGFSVESQSGININRLDKGCLIFNQHRETGFDVYVVDNSNKTEARYWVDDFLHIKRRIDDYSQTENIVSVCKNFISQLPFDIPKSEKAAMMNRVLDGLHEEIVNVETLATRAFGKNLVSSQFKAFKEEYETTHEVCFEPTFKSKIEVIKRSASSSITTIKLDKNFDICIHGGENYIEQGYDDVKQMKFYKIYYCEEK